MALAAGVDLQLNSAKNKVTDTKSPVVRHALQRAAKNTCYMVANSLAMNPLLEGKGQSQGVPIYAVILGVFDVLGMSALAFGEYRAVVRYRRPDRADGTIQMGMSRTKKIVILVILLVIVAVIAVVGWNAYSYIMSKMI